MTQPIKRAWHWFILESDNADFGIGDLLDRAFKDESGATIYEIVPVNPPPMPEPPSPPISVPLWRGTAIGDGYSIRDAAGNVVGATKAGEPLDVWAENVTAGAYSNRVVISHPLEKQRNVWREGVRKA